MSATVASWTEVRIGDLGQVVTGRTHHLGVRPALGPIIGSQRLAICNQGKFARRTERNLSQEGAELLRRIKVPANSLCVSCIGWQMGEVVLTGRTCFTNQQINTLIPNGKTDSSFLYYALRPRKHELLSFGAMRGARTPIINKSAFCDLKVSLPPLSVQRRIASVLGAYDDLIERY